MSGCWVLIILITGVLPKQASILHGRYRGALYQRVGVSHGGLFITPRAFMFLLRALPFELVAQTSDVLLKRLLDLP
jgi:hypothetical protein